MRHLSPGDVTRKLAQIDKSKRGRKWRKRAKAHLLADVKAEPVAAGLEHYRLPGGARVCGKRRFPNFTTAMEALIETWQSPNPKRHEKRVHPCPHCKGWHLTSRPLLEGMNHDERQEAYLKKAGYPQGQR